MVIALAADFARCHDPEAKLRYIPCLLDDAEAYVLETVPYRFVIRHPMAGLVSCEPFWQADRCFVRDGEIIRPPRLHPHEAIRDAFTTMRLFHLNWCRGTRLDLDAWHRTSISGIVSREEIP